MLEFDLLPAVRACRAAIPAMLERGGGGGPTKVELRTFCTGTEVVVDSGMMKT